MAYAAMTNLAYQDLVTEEHLDRIRENIEHLASMKAFGTALSSLAASAELRGPDYDSGWFAVAVSTVYTKAHGLGVVPQNVQVWHSTVAAPTGGTEIVSADAYGPNYGSGIGVDNTNAYLQIGTTSAISNPRRYHASGYMRILAWK